MKKMNDKVKKALRITANVVTILICIFVLIFAIIAITNAQLGYNNVFGSSFLAVKTNSMAGSEKDSFDEGDLVVIKILNDSQKKELKEGDVITFWTLIDGKRDLNTHRIIGTDTESGTVYYTTKGDNNTNNDYPVPDYEVVGKYSYKMKNLGAVLNFMKSPTGFLIFVVIPSILALGYCAYLFIVNLKGFGKEKKAEETARLKAQLLEEIKKEESNNNN